MKRCYLPKTLLSPLMNSLFLQDFRLEVKGTMQIINKGFHSVFLKSSKKGPLKFSGVLLYKSKPKDYQSKPED